DYSTDAEERFWDLTWVHFLPPPHWEAYLRWPIHAIGLRYLDPAHAEPGANFQLALARMLEMSRRTVPRALDLAANALEEALLWAHITSDPTTVSAADERVRRAADYLSINLKKPFQLNEVAAHCGLSVSRLSHLFKAQTGVSPQQFHERQRLQHATQLLRLTGLSVGEVAQEVGFADPFYFSNRFRRAFGKSPLRFRRGEG
ncbi:AraC family transcriptional regulator, partial [bacterium]